MTSTRSVVKPLHATSCQRTRRISRLSAAIASSSAASKSLDAAPSGIAETVPDAADGLDPRALRPELGPEVVDVGVDGVRGHGHAERPGLVEELVAGQRLAGMAEEALEQRELAGAEIDVAAARGHP